MPSHHDWGIEQEAWCGGTPDDEMDNPGDGVLAENQASRVIEGDCLDVLDSFPDAAVDSLIADPPYCAGAISEAQRTRSKGQGLRSENIRRFGWFVGDNMGTSGLAWLLRSVAIEARRVVKPTGSVLLFCDWRMVSALQPAVESAGLRYQGLIVWDKGSMGLGLGFRNRHELILHFTLGEPEYHDKSVGNVIVAGRIGSEEREHQTQKPEELMRPLASVVCPPGGIVLDPFCGSGSCGVACLQVGRRFVGIDHDPEHCRTARRRLAEAEKEQREMLFPAKEQPKQLTFEDAAESPQSENV